MATRQTTYVLKNSDIINRPLPNSLLPGEPIVNTAEGIMYFSGVTSSTSEWTPAGTGATEQTFFEVGSNLYDLRLRNKITSYENVSGLGLQGKILSGTSAGFVLVDSTEINGISAFTYNQLNNTFSIFDSSGDEYSASILQVSGLTVDGNLSVTNTNTVNNLNVTGNTTVEGLTGDTVSLPNLGSGKVIYTSTGGLLTTQNAFSYDDNTNTLNVDNIETAGSIVIQGDLTVLGSSVSAFTTNLFVEDPNLIFNYNPTGSTAATSVNSGLQVQDGNGLVSGDVDLNIIRMGNLTGLTSTEIPNISEYTSFNGYNNRGWITQLNDIVIRSNSVIDNGNAGDINGVRVLAEFDILDGGSY